VSYYVRYLETMFIYYCYMKKGLDCFLISFFLSSSTCKKFGQQSWILCLIIVTESLIGVKFLWTTVILPPPDHIVAVWTCILIGSIVYTCWLFVPSLLRFIRAQPGEETNVTKTAKAD